MKNLKNCVIAPAIAIALITPSVVIANEKELENRVSGYTKMKVYLSEFNGVKSPTIGDLKDSTDVKVLNAVDLLNEHSEDLDEFHELMTGAVKDMNSSKFVFFDKTNEDKQNILNDMLRNAIEQSNNMLSKKNDVLLELDSSIASIQSNIDAIGQRKEDESQERQKIRNELKTAEYKESKRYIKARLIESETRTKLLYSIQLHYTMLIELLEKKVNDLNKYFVIINDRKLYLEDIVKTNRLRFELVGIIDDIKQNTNYNLLQEKIGEDVDTLGSLSSIINTNLEKLLLAH